MWALVDCNTFFASVERVFHPGLRGKPVCVLSSNDGIIVALTAEAKRLGIKRGDAVFKVRDIVESNNVAVFSGNMMLYAAMSKRVVSIIKRSVEKVDQYSIDECFADLSGYDTHYDITEYMREVGDRIRLWTDIPVSIGIAPTKTLAKMGSKFAKQYEGYRSVCLMDTEDKRRKALAMSDLADVWGIGRQLRKKMVLLGVATALDFANLDLSKVKQGFPTQAVKTYRELNGEPCITIERGGLQSSIMQSRTFGFMITELDQLQAEVRRFAADCAAKLRHLLRAEPRPDEERLAAARGLGDLRHVDHELVHADPAADRGALAADLDEATVRKLPAVPVRVADGQGRDPAFAVGDVAGAVADGGPGGHGLHVHQMTAEGQHGTKVHRALLGGTLHFEGRIEAVEHDAGPDHAAEAEAGSTRCFGFE